MSKVRSVKVIVSERALASRINRQLKKDEEQLKKCKVDSRGYSDLGDYYVVDLSKNSVIDTHVDLSVLAKKLGVLADFEAVEK